MAQIYQSKKDDSIFAEYVEYDERGGTTMLEYKTGEKVGKTFSVSKSTLQRWWRKVDSLPGEEVDEPTVEEVQEEILHVEVETDEGVVAMDMSTASGLDDSEVKQYNFNPPEEEKKFIPIPKTVLATAYFETHQLASGEIFPTVEQVVDMCVEWGADVVRFGGFITLDNKTKILFRRNLKILRKSVFEIRMTEDIAVSSKLDYTVEPLRSAMCKGVDYVVRAGSIAELETVIKAIYNN